MDKMSLKFIGVPSNTTVLKGATTVLECAATGYPIPTVRWKKLNGELSVPMSSYGINNLNFTNINETDGGEYECQASSNGQTISRTVWLFVRGNGSRYCNFACNEVNVHIYKQVPLKILKKNSLSEGFYCSTSKVGMLRLCLILKKHLFEF